MELAVGAFMFVALLSLAFFTILLSRDNFFQKTYPLEVVFEDVMGLRDGDNVVVRGMVVGKVRKLVLQADGVHVRAALLRPINLKKDCTVEIIATSVLGGRYMQIEEGSAAEALPADSVLRGQKPHDMIALASSVVADLKAISSQIQAGQGTLGKLIYDDALYNDLNEVAKKINSGQGTLAKLVNDDELYEQAKKALIEVRAAVDDLRETSPIVTFASIYFGAF